MLLLSPCIFGESKAQALPELGKSCFPLELVVYLVEFFLTYKKVFHICNSYSNEFHSLVMHSVGNNFILKHIICLIN